jgi:hypothetical protein
MIQKIINFLNSAPPEDVRTLQALLAPSVTDSIQVDPVTSEDFRSLLRATLDQSVTAATANSVQCTAALNILVYDYTYLVVNTGGTNAAVAYLQASPDGTTWETQSATATISPGTVVSFVPNVIAKYSRLCYQSQVPGNSTTLTIYTQGRS